VDESDPLAPWAPAWAGLRGLREVGWTKATKLIACKRPGLYPTWDLYAGPEVGLWASSRLVVFAYLADIAWSVPICASPRRAGWRRLLSMTFFVVA
jgi:hypothetical protein